MGFWQEWCPAVRAFAAAHGKPDFFMFGEVLDHSDAKCGSYTGTMGGGPFKLDSVVDYPLYFKINSRVCHCDRQHKTASRSLRVGGARIMIRRRKRGW